MPSGATSPSPSDRPTQIGPFRILDVIGEGGMGTVYLGEQREPVQRRAAVKVIKLGMDSKAVVARFEAERKALSLMEHSCIAKVYDAGLTATGQPWFAMEFVKGIPITDYCDQSKLSLEQRIELFQKVCSGVQHAHLKGVMHRDLKPGNVLVTLQDGKPLPKIIDFGLAKATDHRLVEATLFTEHGTVVGTPEYMSPEQAGLGGLDVDTRTDVYSLGVLLYELLTGELPFSRKELHAAGYLEMQRVIREQEPPKPSTKVTTLGERAAALAQMRAMTRGDFGKALRGDLDWITLKALEKDRTRRYDTAQELAADLERYRKLEPVLATPPSFGYRATKFVRKYRVQCVAAVVVAIAIVAGGLGTAMGYADAREQARLAKESERKAEAAANEAKAQAEHAKAQEQVAKERADEIAALAKKDRVYADIARLQDAEARADAMWPAVPSRLPDLEQWLRDVEPIVQRLPSVESEIAALRQRSKPMAEAERAALQTAAATEVERLRAEFEQANANDRRTLRADLADAAVVQETAGFAFDSRADQESHLQLAKLATSIRALLQDGDVSTRGLIASVRARILDAQRVARVMAAHEEAWQNAIEAIASSDRYGGMRLRVHEGLVPIGMDPVSKLWEFVHVASGAAGKEIPVRDPATGQLVPTGEMGIALVLLPGGTFWMGAQKDDPSKPNHDPDARDAEGPVHQVTLSPFFVGKYEVTQGQWLRWTGRNPSYSRRRGELALPVDMVTWFDCREWSRLAGLLLPTEAQWEYACRAGTTSPWWTGVGEDSVASGVVVSTDQVALVGSKAANAFGLFDVAGNVLEWCLDSWDRNADYPSSAVVDPYVSSGPSRVLRGGSWVNVSHNCRSASRDLNYPGITNFFLGFRVCLAPVLVR